MIYISVVTMHFYCLFEEYTRIFLQFSNLSQSCYILQAFISLYSAPSLLIQVKKVYPSIIADTPRTATVVYYPILDNSFVAKDILTLNESLSEAIVFANVLIIINISTSNWLFPHIVL